MKPHQRPRKDTFWRDASGTQIRVLSVRKGVVTWVHVPTPRDTHTTPVKDWRMQRVWIGGERDFPMYADGLPPSQGGK